MMDFEHANTLHMVEIFHMSLHAPGSYYAHGEYGNRGTEWEVEFPVFTTHSWDDSEPYLNHRCMRGHDLRSIVIRAAALASEPSVDEFDDRLADSY